MNMFVLQQQTTQEWNQRAATNAAAAAASSSPATTTTAAVMKAPAAAAAVVVNNNKTKASQDADDLTGTAVASIMEPAANSNTMTNKTSNKNNKNNNKDERIAQLKRERRLAQNRDCARARRRRKKMRLEYLEDKVSEMQTKCTTLELEKEALMARALRLEQELNLMKKLQSNKATAPYPSAPHSSSTSSSSLLGGIRTTPAANHKMDLSSLVGGCAAATRGLHKASTNKTLAAQQDLQYMELLRQARAQLQQTATSGNSSTGLAALGATAHDVVGISPNNNTMSALSSLLLPSSSSLSSSSMSLLRS